MDSRSQSRIHFMLLVITTLLLTFCVYLFESPKPAELYFHDNNSVQFARNQTIHNVCDPQIKLNKQERHILLQHLLVDDNNHIIYCYVPKVACTNWKRVLLVLSGQYKSVEEINEVDHLEVKHNTSLSRYTAEEIQYRLDNYFKFMFVRHPLDRLYSAWHNKFYEDNAKSHYFHTHFGKKIVKNFRNNPPPNPEGNDVTLEEFFKYILSTNFWDLNQHWMPFVHLCQPCYVNYTYIGLQENLEVEANAMLELLNLSDKVSFPTKQESYYENTPPNDDKIKAWQKISPELFTKVVRKFAIDFNLYGYKLPSSVEEYIQDQLIIP